MLHWQVRGVDLSEEEVLAEEMAQKLAAPHVNFYDPVLFQDLEVEVCSIPRDTKYTLGNPPARASIGIFLFCALGFLSISSLMFGDKKLEKR